MKQISEKLKNYLNKYPQRTKSIKEGRKKTVYSLSHNSDRLIISHLTLENVVGNESFRWDEVISAYVFKRDLFVIDCICLIFELKEERFLEIDEEMNGWIDLVKNLPKYWDGCEKFEEWFLKVAFPAFKANLIEIYKKGEDDGERED